MRRVHSTTVWAAACMLQILSFQQALTAADSDADRQTIPEAKYQTPHYQLSVFQAGHFAIKVGGSWMPGCICLNVNGVPQYRTQQLSHMTCSVTRHADGRTIVVRGRLTPDIEFEQTVEARAQRVILTYDVRALNDLPAADIRITAGPQLEHATGLQFEVQTESETISSAFPPEAPVHRKDVRSVSWLDLGKRNARTVFEHCAGAYVSIAEGRAVYTALVRGDGPMNKGDTARAQLHFEVNPSGDAADTVATMRGELGHTMFGISGTAGLLNNVRTHRGLLIQQFSINEDDVHQVTVGRGSVAGWGGVKLSRKTPGEAYTVEAGGKIVNAWKEHVEARRRADDTDEIRFRARRTITTETKRLRVLMYVAQRFEQERTPYLIRTPDGETIDNDDGKRLWFGMPPKANEAGLGRYRQLGEYPAGTEIAVPMLARHERFSIKLGQPMRICGFRFEIYFRGLWFESIDPAATDLDFTVTVRRLPELHVGRLSVTEDPDSGAVGVDSGGMPVFDRLQPCRGAGVPCDGDWRWETREGRAIGTVRLDGGGDAAGLMATIPLHLYGKTIRLTPTQETAAEANAPVALRLGSASASIPLPAGTRIEFAPTALERVVLTPDQSSEIALTRAADGAGLRLLSHSTGGASFTVEHHVVAAPEPDPIALRLRAHDRSRSNPDLLGSLSVNRDQPEPGDVTVLTPWWRVIHSRAAGGAISAIAFVNGTNRNLLRNPITTRLAASGIFADTAEPDPTIEVAANQTDYVRLRISGFLRGPGGEALCPFEHVYEYRPMLVRRTCTYALGATPVDCTGIAIGSLELAPWLDEAVTRRESHRTAWHKAIFPGPPVFEDTTFSQYLCLFQRGVEGIDWLPACELRQWRHVGTGAPGTARYAIEGDDRGNPVMVIEPLAFGSDPVKLSGELRFESFLSLPQVKRCLQRRNFVACLDNGHCSEDFIKFSAEYGVTDIMLGAANTPGTFELADLQACQRTVRLARKHNIKVYPFDPFQLVSRKAPIWQQHEEWGRCELRNGKPELKVYSSYGDYFCPTAEGFRDALKKGYAQMVESAGFGGLYHDFEHPYVCFSTKHAAAPHMNTDGVLDMILWDRAFLGPERVFCGHTGWVPVLLFQDLCTVSAIFEEYPSSAPLPLYLTPAQGEFVNAAQMTLVSSFIAHGTVAPGEDGLVAPPADQVNAYLARCALVGIFPWAHAGNIGATDAYDLPDKIRPWYRLFAIRGTRNLASMQFLPYHRQTAVLCDNPYVRAATYWSAVDAIIVLANSESPAPASFRIKLLPDQFGWPQDSEFILTPSRDCPALVAGPGPREFEGGLQGYEFAAYHLSTATR